MVVLVYIQKMKTIVYLIILIIWPSWIFSTNQALGCDEGTDSIYLLTTARQLREFADSVNAGNDFQGKTIKLQADIRLNDTTGWRQWDQARIVQEWAVKSWTPVGSKQHPFKGTFDGQGHTITGIYTNAGMEGLYQGLFGFVYGGKIRNLRIEASFIKGYNYVGSIAGFIGGQTEILNCCNSGTVVCERNIAGGIVGFSRGINRIVNCHNTGKITGQREIGGIIGFFERGTIKNCSNRGTIIGKYDIAGGIVGRFTHQAFVVPRWNDARMYEEAFNVIATHRQFADTPTNLLTPDDSLINSLIDSENLNLDIKDTNSTGEYYKAKTYYPRGEIVRTKYFGFYPDPKEKITYKYTDTLANCYNTGLVKGRDNIGGIAGILHINFHLKKIVFTNCYHAGITNSRYMTETNGITGILAGAETNLLNPANGCFWNEETSMSAVNSKNVRETPPATFFGLKTQEMQSQDFVILLNGWPDSAPHQGLKHWKADTEKINNGYPIFEDQ